MWDTLANTSWISIFFVFQKHISQNQVLLSVSEHFWLRAKLITKIKNKS